MFIDDKYLKEYFDGKRVAVIGSAPNALNNNGDHIDGFDSVVRVNNYKLFPTMTGKKTDVHYAFYGSSVRKTREELIKDGVKLCMCKCPNSQPIESAWHVEKGKKLGIDFRYIYKKRENFWFCPTYIPTDETFLTIFKELDGHIPTTGFSAIWELLRMPVKELYITGFDFFSSGKHNINERWIKGDPTDPIGHKPKLERLKVIEYSKKKVVILDEYLKRLK